MYKNIFRPVSSTSISFSRRLTSKEKLKCYQFPDIKKEDVDQQFISGWGPGGQNVNKSINCVRLRHIPTNVQVKVHETRSREKNLVIAYERLKFAVDRHLNKENCYEEQLERLEHKRTESLKRTREKKRQKKADSKQELLETELNT